MVCVQESSASIANDELLADMLQQMEVIIHHMSQYQCMLTFDPL